MHLKFIGKPITVTVLQIFDKISKFFVLSNFRIRGNLQNTLQNKVLNNFCAFNLDPYVKVVLCDETGTRLRSRCSMVKQNTLAPRWETNLSFNVRQRQLNAAALEFFLLDHDFIGNDEIMAYVYPFWFLL